MPVISRSLHSLDHEKVAEQSRGSGKGSEDGDSSRPDISSDGRFVVFESVAPNLLDTVVPSGMIRVFLRDREHGTIRLLSTAAEGAAPREGAWTPAISADGTTVVFWSAASNPSGMCRSAAPGPGLYLVRPSDDACLRVDVTSAGIPQHAQSTTASVSGDGRYVAFVSRADLTCRSEIDCPGELPDRNGLSDVYVRDVARNVTVRVSRNPSGHDPDGPSYQPAISSDGRYVVFVSEASNLVARIRNRVPHVYIHDMTTGITELVSRTPAGRSANGASRSPAVSRDGLMVAFQSRASDLVCETNCGLGGRDINLVSDVFVHDRRTRRTIRLSADGGEEWMEYSRAPSLDDSGRVVVFVSPHSIDERDRDFDEDLYVRRLAPIATTSR
jgi:Tol biopolymer transport system component